MIKTQSNNVNFKARLIAKNGGNWNIKTADWAVSRALAKQIGDKNDLIIYEFGSEKTKSIHPDSAKVIGYYSKAGVPVLGPKHTTDTYERCLSLNVNKAVSKEVSTGVKCSWAKAPSDYHPVKFLEAKLQELIDNQKKK